jgi:hypothetical protein
MLISSAILFFYAKSQAGLIFNYSQLALKDLDQMSAFVQSKVQESKKTTESKWVPLKEGLQAVYSRPNEDEMIEKVVAPLRNSLNDLESWEKTISQLTDEAINALKNPKAFKPVVQVTYITFLQNLIGEVKPFIKDVGFEKSIIERVRDAKIEISQEASNEARVRSMKSLVSPSKLAQNVLESGKLKKEVAGGNSSPANPAGK